MPHLDANVVLVLECQDLLLLGLQLLLIRPHQLQNVEVGVGRGVTVHEKALSRSQRAGSVGAAGRAGHKAGRSHAAGPAMPFPPPAAQPSIQKIPGRIPSDPSRLASPKEASRCTHRHQIVPVVGDGRKHLRHGALNHDVPNQAVALPGRIQRLQCLDDQVMLRHL